METIKTANGEAELVLSPAPYRTAVNLKRVILKEISNNALGLKLVGDSNKIEDVLKKDLDFTGFIDFIKNTLINFDISENIDNVLWECLNRCTYNGRQIKPELFDDDTLPQIREDDYEIKIRCIEVNLRPFFKSLASMWKTLAPKIGKNQALSQILSQMNK